MNEETPDEVLEALSDLVNLQREFARRQRELWEAIESSGSVDLYERGIAIASEVR